MKKIVAIGGGEIGFNGSKFETIALDKESIRLTGKANPKLLFIPTASHDAAGYVEQVHKYFGKKLGCIVDSLELTKNKYTLKQIQEKILGTDIIYVGGGNTLFLMNTWRRLGVDKILKKAYAQGIVMTGQSAGSICWFTYGNSDSRAKPGTTEPNMIRVGGIGLIDALHCPHYDRDVARPASLEQMMKKMSGVGIALDNCTAIEVIDDKFRILRSKPTANAYKVYWNKGEYCREKISVSKNLQSLAQLLKK